MSIKLQGRAGTQTSSQGHKYIERRLVGRGVVGSWTRGIPELHVGDQHFIYLGGEVLECAALAKCKSCHKAWGEFSLCPECAEVAKLCRLGQNRRLAAYEDLREQNPKMPSFLIWELVNLSEELA